ncbi:uncharacterized protein TM35_000381010 [Trypanosoma theileri]|uniref:Uncharacterized protein n=1 Tax=Trypanosoma theileri TaxID=67003 RepID=A0A1X0NK21_9TRYP|nr:uncharacterized protein TM35_000381010 [Trypanosoma theileri]ORC85026.1 hypothetical protein TM35_000381010 [Trypanosoma theileri]
MGARFISERLPLTANEGCNPRGWVWRAVRSPWRDPRCVTDASAQMNSPFFMFYFIGNKWAPETPTLKFELGHGAFFKRGEERDEVRQNIDRELFGLFEWSHFLFFVCAWTLVRNAIPIMQEYSSLCAKL